MKRPKAARWLLAVSLSTLVATCCAPWEQLNGSEACSPLVASVTWKLVLSRMA